ncbi:hypothetical protein SAMN02910275_02431 [Butyrivibrio sp. INlla18]|uniref:glycosyltransferase family 2 protein n=1 Tax=Butyrivibrio sp. INlla18 TaxID=1520806 RepID=UPI00088A7F06|nr:glycosyltransferase family 2 protein [Butyrivibrio sp. INlla18]SDA72966.1 hypothetical protein SAMN02910275_02431 [Butyrivibrio sp. INlla18]
MEKKIKTLVIIPAYNESECIERVVDNLRKNYSEYDYIVVDDASTDGTRAVLDKIKANYVSLPVNLGIGGAVQTGYRYALENGYDIAIQMDGDGQHDPNYLHALVEPLNENEADIAIGSRFITKEGFQSSRSRRLGIKILSDLLFVLLHKRYYDVTSGYRAVNKKFISLFSFDYPQDYPEPEAIMISSRNNAVIKEIPVIMRERDTGESSINLKKSMYYMCKVSLAIVISFFQRVKGE